MYVALGLYQDSEGAYPMAKDWMSAISTRLRTTDMTQDEASKKEIRPNLPNPQPGQYGYAINENAAGKFKGDLKTPQTVLIYESPDLSKNAHGVPPSGTGALGITVDGSIVHL